MKFRYLIEPLQENDEKNQITVEFEHGGIRAHGSWELSNERIPDTQDWIFALEFVALNLAKQLQESRKDIDQLAEALEQALKKIDKEPTAARGTIWDQELVDCMGQKVKIADIDVQLLTKDEK